MCPQVAYKMSQSWKWFIIDLLFLYVYDSILRFSLSFSALSKPIDLQYFSIIKIFKRHYVWNWNLNCELNFPIHTIEL